MQMGVIGSCCVDGEDTINTRSTDLQSLGNLRRTQSLVVKLLDLVEVDAWLSSLVDPRSLGLGDPFHLAFSTEVGLELGEDTQHVQKALPRRRTGIYGLLGGLQHRTLGLQPSYDVLEV